MADHQKMITLLALVSLTVVLSTCITYLYITSKLSMLRQKRSIGSQQKFTRDCYNHSTLCQLRFVLTDEAHFGIALSQDVYDFKALDYLKNSYLAQGMDLHKVFDNTADMREAVEIYRADEYSFEAIKRVVDLAKIKRGPCRHVNRIPYTYICHISSHTDADVRVTCDEFLSAKPTSGGSSLYGLVTGSHHRAACVTTDLQSGTYHFNCPYLLHAKQIRITATSFNFAAFEYDCYKYAEHIVKNVTLPDNFRRSDSRKTIPNVLTQSMLPCSSLKKRSTLAHSPGFWIEVSEDWYWSNSECYYPYNLSRPQLTHLQNTSLLLIGDSHMLSKYKEIKREYPQAETRFQLAGLAAQLAVQLKALVREYRSSSVEKLLAKEHKIIFNVGHWDIHFLDIFAYITNMDDVFQAIMDVKQEPPNPRMIWLQSTPVGWTRRHAFMKTTPIISALNDWTAFKLRTLGVEVIHAYDIAIPMLDKVREDGTHFPTAFGAGVRNLTGEVNVSGAIISVLLDVICRNKEK